ncbi:MAG: nitroreductase [Spirochaetales bacterium]|nr:nitroreductase [Spirochaetales bacterium]
MKKGRKRLRIPVIRRIYADLFDTIMARSSERDFLDKEIDYEKIDVIMESARWAPSWQNKQCWEYIVVKNKNLIKEIAKSSSFVNLWIAKAPCIIVSCADPSLSGFRDGLPYFLVDTAIATEHLVLAATALGFGTCWVGAFNEEKIKELLEIPENIRIVALIPIGYPVPQKPTRVTVTNLILSSNRRKWTDEFVHWEKW